MVTRDGSNSLDYHIKMLREDRLSVICVALYVDLKLLMFLFREDIYRESPLFLFFIIYLNYKIVFTTLVCLS